MEATAADPTADDNYVYGIYTEFLGAFLAQPLCPRSSASSGGPSHRKRAMGSRSFPDEGAGEIVSDPEPTFTFAHFLLPHVPYIFLADGSFVPSDQIAPSKRCTSIS